jgi:lipopolysaccharide/colanic/teichoic acid biosynthesis glycosyltransferase
MNSKRILDFSLSLLGLALFAPLLLGIMFLIILEDGRPVLFSQQRVGRDLRPFICMKFRSMHNGEITRVGRWIRKTGLDELLQFINVLQGTMSIVGPRPLTRQDAERLGLYDVRLPRYRLRPGITGMAQLYGGRGIRVTRFLERTYIDRQSICLDLIIVILSFLVNIFGKPRVGNWLVWLRKMKRVENSIWLPG